MHLSQREGRAQPARGFVAVTPAREKAPICFLPGILLRAAGRRWILQGCANALLGRRVPLAGRRGPVAPVPPQPRLGTAEAGIVLQQRVARVVVGGHLTGERRAHFAIGEGDIKRPGRLGRAMPLTQVEDQFRPEEAAHRRVRRGLWRSSVEGGEQWKNCDQVAAAILHPSAERCQVAQVADRATPP